MSRVKVLAQLGLRCREAGVRPSMGSVGDAFDDAMAESAFATLATECLDERRFRTRTRPASSSSATSKGSQTRTDGTPTSTSGHPSTTNRPKPPTPPRAMTCRPDRVSSTHPSTASNRCRSARLPPGETPGGASFVYGLTAR